MSESSSGVFPPHFLPTNTMTIEISVGKVLARKGQEAGRASAIPTGSFIYDLESKATTGFPVLAV